MGITLLMGDLLAITCGWYKDRKYFEHMFIITPVFFNDWMDACSEDRENKKTNNR
ncbi:MAG: hypothetical protein PHD28_08410 [Proteiniphilum sp.]|nr:hypothetical protein [Proteiniphilum sp.]